MPKVLFTAGAVASAATMFAAGLAVPAEAAPAATTPVAIKYCSKTVGGVLLRVKMRFDDRVLRVRVSHPDGTGNFENNRVRRTAATLFFEGPTVPPDENGNSIGSAAWAQRYGDQPVYRTRNYGVVNTAVVTFKLVNGKRATVTCEKRL